MEDVTGSSGGEKQAFLVRIDWSAESEGRLTEADVKEAIEQLTLEIDEEVDVEVEERLDMEE
jgi:hypothetical protein